MPTEIRWNPLLPPSASLEEPSCLKRTFSGDILTYCLEANPVDWLRIVPDTLSDIPATLIVPEEDSGPWNVQIAARLVPGRGESQPWLRLRFNDPHCAAHRQSTADCHSILLDPAFEDPSLLRASGYEWMIQAARLPFMRTGHARVRLNGASCGLYVVREETSAHWWARSFGRESGRLEPQPIGGTGSMCGSDATRLSVWDNCSAANRPAAQPGNHGGDESTPERFDARLDQRTWLRILALEEVARPESGLRGDLAMGRAAVMDSGEWLSWIADRDQRVFAAPRCPIMIGLARNSTGVREVLEAYLDEVEFLADPEIEAELLIELADRRAALRPSMADDSTRQRLESSAALLERQVRARFASVRDQAASWRARSAEERGAALDRMIEGVPLAKNHPRAENDRPSSEASFDRFWRAASASSRAGSEAGAPGGPTAPERMELSAPPDVLEKLSWRDTRWVEVTVRIGEREFHRVGLRLKGKSTRQNFAGKPSFTLKFNWKDNAQRLDGLAKLHVHNARFDRSFLNEHVGAWLCHRAGIASPKTGHVRLAVNGRDYGLFVTVEGVTESVLEREFGGRGGLLWEGEDTDLDGSLDLDNGRPPPGHSDPRRLGEAARESLRAKSIEPIRALCDVPALARFVAGEVLLGHEDGYCFNVNNYRIWQGAPGEPIQWMAHGMDRLGLVTERGLFPPMRGLLARALTETPDGRMEYAKAMEFLLRHGLDLEELGQEIARVSVGIQQALREAEPHRAPAQLDGARELLAWLGERRTELLGDLERLRRANSEVGNISPVAYADPSQHSPSPTKR